MNDQTNEPTNKRPSELNELHFPQLIKLNLIK